MTELSLASVLAEPARRFPGRVALVHGDRRYSYAELWGLALAKAGELRAEGVRPGDRVALLAPNTAEFPIAYYAVLAAGGVVVPVHLLLSPEEIRYVLEDSGARAVLAADAVAEPARAAAPEGVPVLPAAPAEGAEPLPGRVSRQAEDPAVVLYTSGTTGRPKGAVLTHLNLVMNATVAAFDTDAEPLPEERILCCLPLFHAYGQTAAMNAVFRKAAAAVLQPRFRAEEALELMRRERITGFLGVPTMLVALLRAVASGGEPAPRLRRCSSGGASLPVAVLEEFERVFGTEVHEGYGLSETSPIACRNQPEFGVRPGSVGHPIWGVEAAAADPAVPDRIAFVEPGELGEIVLRGHNVFAGYLGRPEATAEALVDGWFRTGDLGTVDATGRVTIVDRTKDVIIRGGFNVYPREVEEALVRHPAVASAAVIGVPDELHGEEVCAVLVPADGVERPTAEEITAWARERLGRHMYPRRVEFADELPMGASMKVLKRELRRRYT